VSFTSLEENKDFEVLANDQMEKEEENEAEQEEVSADTKTPEQVMRKAFSSYKRNSQQRMEVIKALLKDMSRQEKKSIAVLFFTLDK
jgi:hypothetical protein